MKKENKKIDLIKKKLKDEIFIINFLTYLAFFIIFINTLLINSTIAFYVLAIEILIDVLIRVFGIMR
ncbi:MAG: hypothetical protein ACLRXV_03710 [Clostridium sp.]|jgi:hypothetical protein|nr:MAG TPA: hypothetical protein [Caudoviricetes sp.]